MRLVALDLFLLNPFYTFWSRTFMIESLAMALSLAYLACGLRNTCGKARGWLLLAAASGSLAVMVKVTTFAAFAVLMAAVIIGRYLFGQPGDHWSDLTFRVLATLGVPLAAVSKSDRRPKLSARKSPIPRRLLERGLQFKQRSPNRGEGIKEIIA